MQINRHQSKFITGLATLKQVENWFSTPHPPGLVICGRSNVGKSSLINWLFKKDLAKTSNTPGKTREINVFEFTFQGSENPFYLYDLPGYGHARVSKEQKKHWNQLIPLFFSNLTAHDLCIQIQDARHLMMDSDLEFLNLVNQYHPPLCLLVNKWDKLKKQADRSKVNNTIKNKIMPLNNVSYIFKSSTISHLGEAEILSCFYQKLMASDF